MEVTVSASPQQNELSDTISIDFPWPNCWGSRRRRGRSLRPCARMLVALVVSAQIFLLGAPAAREIFLHKQAAAAAITGITAGVFGSADRHRMCDVARRKLLLCCRGRRLCRRVGRRRAGKRHKQQLCRGLGVSRTHLAHMLCGNYHILSVAMIPQRESLKSRWESRAGPRGPQQHSSSQHS